MRIPALARKRIQIVIVMTIATLACTAEHRSTGLMSQDAPHKEVNTNHAQMTTNVKTASFVGTLLAWIDQTN